MTLGHPFLIGPLIKQLHCFEACVWKHYGLRGTHSRWGAHTETLGPQTHDNILGGVRSLSHTHPGTSAAWVQQWTSLSLSLFLVSVLKIYLTSWELIP